MPSHKVMQKSIVAKNMQLKQICPLCNELGGHRSLFDGTLQVRKNKEQNNQPVWHGSVNSGPWHPAVTAKAFALEHQSTWVE